MAHSIVGYIKQYAEVTPNKLAVIDQNILLTYKQYWNCIETVASYLQNIGVKDREYILVINSQDVRYLILIHAIQYVGGIVVPLEKSVNQGRILELKEQTNAMKLFGDVSCVGLSNYCIDEALAYQGDIQEFPLPLPSNDSMILFTTGTTGKSKGIVLDYASEVAVGKNVTEGTKMKPDNIELSPMPLNHSFGLRRYFGNMVNGSTVVVIDGVFFVKIVFEMMEKYKVTSIAIAPGAMNIILKLTKNKLSIFKDQLDYIQFGSAPILEADKMALIELLPNTRMYNFYGSTEVGCVCILDFNTSDNELGCIGYPGKYSDFKIIDEQGNEKLDASYNNPGLITYTGSMIMKGYYNEPELTSTSLINGYLQTSDLGYIDEQGKVYMLGRADDVISSGGNKISPIEVEEVANEVEGVVECICKGKEDKLIGAVPVLYVVVDKHYDLKKLEQHFLDKLEDFKRPRQIIEIDCVPKTYNGKIDRKIAIG